MKPHFSNGNSPVTVFGLSLLFSLQAQSSLTPLTWFGIYLYLCNFFLLYQTTDHSNKPQICQTSEAVTTKAFRGTKEEQGRGRLDLALHFFFLSASFIRACLHFHQRKSVCGVRGCEFYIASLRQFPTIYPFKMPQKKKGPKGVHSEHYCGKACLLKICGLAYCTPNFPHRQALRLRERGQFGHKSFK